MPAKSLSAEQLADAARLRARYAEWKERRKAAGEPFSQSVASDELGFGQSALSQYLNGLIPLNPDALLKLCALVGVSPADVSPSLAAKMRQTAAVWLEIAAGAPTPPAPSKVIAHPRTEAPPDSRLVKSAVQKRRGSAAKKRIG